MKTLEGKQTIQDAALNILGTAIYLLDDLKKTDKEEYLKYAPGVLKMCVDYSRTYE